MSETTKGTIQSVIFDPISVALTADAATGATVLSIDWTPDLNEDGGLVSINGTTYEYETYTEVDDDSCTITLTAPGLTAAALTDDPIMLLTSTGVQSMDYSVEVNIGGGEAPVTAEIPMALVPHFLEGDEQEGTLVNIELDGPTYRVATRPGEVPELDLSYADPRLIPRSTSSDGSAPSVSPPITVKPLGYSGVSLSWSPVANPDPVSYRVFLDTVNPPVQQLVDTAGTMAATSVLPNGTALDPAVTYYAQVEAYDLDGAAARGPVGSGGPVVVPANAVAAEVMVVNDLFTRAGYFGRVSAEQIDTGELRAALAVVGGLSVGPGITITPDNGIVIKGPMGDTVFPTKDAAILLNGDVIAKSLSILDNFAMRGKNNEVATGAELIAQAGTTTPKVGPTLLSVYPESDCHGGFNPRGFAKVSGQNRYLTTETVFNDGGIYSTYQDASGDYVFAFEQFSLSGTAAGNGGRTEVSSAVGGVTITGDNRIFMLCRTNETVPGTTTYQGRWYVYEVGYNPAASGNAKFTYRRRWLYETSNLGGGSDWDPSIGLYSDNEVAISQRGKNGRWYITRWAVGSEAAQASGSLVTTVPLGYTDGTWVTFAQNAAGVLRTAADSGTTRWYVAFEDYQTTYVFDASGQRLKGSLSEPEDWLAPATPRRGLCWDGTRFKTRNDESAYDMSRIRETDLATNKPQVRQTWRKHDASDAITTEVGDFAQFETTASPIATVTHPRRAWLQISSPSPIPTDGGGDALSFYMNRAVDGTDRSTFHRITPPQPGVQVILLDQLVTVGGPPPATTSFGAATPALIKSAGVNTAGQSTWELNGGGPGRVGPWAWTADGKDASDSGWIDVTAFSNGWSQYASPNWQIRYKREGKRVYLEGLIAPGSGSSGATAFTLPVGFRPAKDQLFPTMNSSSTAQRLDVTAAGLVRPYGTGAWVTLFGFSWAIE